MMYLVSIFCSPLYFLIRGKWLGFILNTILYGLAVLCLITIVGAFIAPVFWILAVGHAAWHLRKDGMKEQAELIATAMNKRQSEQ